MHLITPKGLHYPITVTKLRCQLNDTIEQHAPVFDYTYKTSVIEGSLDDREGKPVERLFPSTFESYVRGTVTQWFLQPGSTLTRAGARIAEIEEPCKHDVQFGGMCANCGKDMTTVEYDTVELDTARATVNTVHGHTTLLISEAEASKSDEEAKRRLLSSRKLSLVVDLDQTIIQATVDTTIADWQNDPTNPNYQALTDVGAFQPQNDFRTYFIKPRPGLQDFLEAASQHYEMHIYTAAARDYAHEVAKLVDPLGKYFADRILSRDESGNKTFKNLQRLFPVDTKMVVIIDDRGDVWHWSRNLVRVKPFDFFVGVGDINSSFLPKQVTIDSGVPASPTSDPRVTMSDETEQNNDAGQEQATSTGEDASSTDAHQNAELHAGGTPKDDNDEHIDSSVVGQLVAMSSGNSPDEFEKQTQEQDEKLAAQVAERPLLQQQRLLDEADKEAENTLGPTNGDSTLQPDSHADASQRPRHSLLKNDDNELVYLRQSLDQIHHAFYSRYDNAIPSVRGSRVAELRPGQAERQVPDDFSHVPDVANIMASMKDQVLRGTSIVLSGVVPLGLNIFSSTHVQWANSFGAVVTDNINSKTTHIIASPLRKTYKVRKAARYPDRIKIVSLAWLEDSLSQWRKLDEEPYLTHREISAANSKQTSPTASLPDESGGQSDRADDGISDDSESADESSSGRTPPSTNDDDKETEEELKAYMPSLSREDSSSNAETTEDWASIDDELNEFLGSDAEDVSESEVESVASDPTRTPESARKRKRGDEADKPDTDGDDESDDSVSRGSKLQKRKKKALARVSSLSTNVTPIEEPAPLDGTERHDLGDGLPPSTKQKGLEAANVDSDSDEDDFGAELEAEFSRQQELDDGKDDAI